MVTLVDSFSPVVGSNVGEEGRAENATDEASWLSLEGGSVGVMLMSKGVASMAFVSETTSWGTRLTL